MRSLTIAVATSVALLAALAPRPGAATECWQGWGYWVDARTRAYKSEEMLLVTRGPAVWAAGWAVVLHVLDRATGRIAESVAPIRAVPIDPRAFYRGNANYVDGWADVENSDDRLVFGLSQVAPPAAPIPELEAFTAWACGLGRSGDSAERARSVE